MRDPIHIVLRMRAAGRCEYCHLPEAHVTSQFEIEHIIPRQHWGSDTLGNLAYACAHCNRYKGPNLSGIDYRISRIRPVRLFHPRLHTWSYHFKLHGPLLIGRTAIGRTTIDVLKMNSEVQQSLRQLLLDEGLFPPG